LTPPPAFYWYSLDGAAVCLCLCLNYLVKLVLGFLALFLPSLNIVPTSRRTARGTLRHAALPDNYRQVSQKLSMLMKCMAYSTNCGEWTEDYFDLGFLSKSVHFWRRYARKTIFTFPFPV